MLFGVSLGLSACVLWGFTYLLPLLLPQYPTTYISIARAIAMGITAVVGLYLQRQYLAKVTRSDWKFAFWLSLVGNLIQPWCLFTAVLYSGVALAATFFGLIPVLVALIANERDRKKGKLYLPVRRLTIPLVMMMVGLILSNFDGLLQTFSNFKEHPNFLIGIFFACASTAMWTWYPIRNADWLLDHPQISPVFFASMQCFLLLPFGIAAYIILWFWSGDLEGFLGPKPVNFIGWSLFAGIICSFGATALWNAMCQKVPTAIAGPMLVFETIFSVAWGCVYAKELPGVTLSVGMALLVGGVIYALTLFNSLQKKEISNLNRSEL
ncbi:DMT family transporter [uncultured Parasutterella sp.]|uniref:DMT family transporter n=1 Tax=uncultured Parasutterella sp. TaxID=1263098 RepID=UPI0025B62858|nr:DMT family transporter [uncultured Parasutterella sp.]